MEQNSTLNKIAESKTLASVTKIIGYVASFGIVTGMLWGAYKFIDTSNKTAGQLKEVVTKVDSLSRKIDGISMQGYRLSRMMQDLNVEMALTGEQNERYHKSYIQYVKDNTKTSQELFKYIEGLDLEVKKN